MAIARTVGVPVARALAVACAACAACVCHRLGWCILCAPASRLRRDSVRAALRAAFCPCLSPSCLLRRGFVGWWRPAVCPACLPLLRVSGFRVRDSCRVRIRVECLGLGLWMRLRNMLRTMHVDEAAQRNMLSLACRRVPSYVLLPLNTLLPLHAALRVALCGPTCSRPSGAERASRAQASTSTSHDARTHKHAQARAHTHRHTSPEADARGQAGPGGGAARRAR